MCDGQLDHSVNCSDPVTTISDQERRIPISLPNSTTTTSNNYDSSTKPKPGPSKKIKTSHLSANLTSAITPRTTTVKHSKNVAGKEPMEKEKDSQGRTIFKPNLKKGSRGDGAGVSLPTEASKRAAKSQRQYLAKSAKTSFTCGGCDEVFHTNGQLATRQRSIECNESSIHRHDPTQLPKDGSVICCGEEGGIDAKGGLISDGGCGQKDCLRIFGSLKALRYHVNSIKLALNESSSRLTTHNARAIVGLHACDGVVCGNSLCTWYYSKHYNKLGKWDSSKKRSECLFLSVIQRFNAHLDDALRRKIQQIAVLREFLACLVAAFSNPDHGDISSTGIHSELLTQRATRLVKQLQAEYEDDVAGQLEFKSENGTVAIRTLFVSKEGGNLPDFPPIIIDALSDRRCVDCGTGITPRWVGKNSATPKCGPCNAFPKSFTVEDRHEPCIRCDCHFSYVAANYINKGPWDEATGLCRRCFHIMYPLARIIGGPCVTCGAKDTSDEWRNFTCSECRSSIWRQARDGAKLINSAEDIISAPALLVASPLLHNRQSRHLGVAPRVALKTLSAEELFVLNGNNPRKKKIELRDPHIHEEWDPKKQRPPPTFGPSRLSAPQPSNLPL